MALEATLNLPDDVLARLADLVAERVSTHAGEQSPWLDVDGAADYLVTSEGGIRGHVKRRTIPVHRIHGRLLFHRDELDAWVRNESA